MNQIVLKITKPFDHWSWKSGLIAGSIVTNIQDKVDPGPGLANPSTGCMWLAGRSLETFN